MHTVLKNTTSSDTFDVTEIRKDFPILSTQVHGKPLVYLDNAATTQKPLSVITACNSYYLNTNSNIHRGVHYLSQNATKQYEESRKKIASFINAPSEKQIIFTRGTTESINLVASSFGRKFIGEGDEIIISAMEHHSNIVPWQMLCEEKKAILKVIPISDSGELIIEEFRKLLSNRTKLVSLVHVSNSLGTINPVEEIVELSRSSGAKVLIDGAQAIQHISVDVQALDCDFYVFSGHKLYGPTGIGVLFGKKDLLDAMPPYQGGGDMIASVTFEKTIYNDLPYKFEAGTPNIEGVIGLGAAIDYINSVGFNAIKKYEDELSVFTLDELSKIDNLKLIGTAKNRTGAFSFVLEGIHPHDIGTIMDFEGIAIRTGHHCTQPVMKRFNIPATARISLAFYNTKDEISFAAEAIRKVFKVFA